MSNTLSTERIKYRTNKMKNGQSAEQIKCQKGNVEMQGPAR